MTQHPTAKSIRERHPDPIKVKDRDLKDNGYCVGGAVLLYFGRYGEDYGFPTSTLLKQELTWINPILPEGRAQELAYDILLSNDNGEFERAWALVDEALNYRPE